MARGGRGRRGGGGGPDAMDVQDILISVIPQLMMVDNSMLTSSGSEIMFHGKIDSLTSQQTQGMTQMNITITGQKVKAKNGCCYCMTIGFGSLLIFPLCFMCCQWWKNIVHSKYAMDIRTYELIANLIKKCPLVTFLNLSVYDNNLTRQKMEILTQAISQSGISRFSLVNNVLESNYRNNEYSNFEQNAQCFRRLSLKSCQIQWKTTIVNITGNNGTNYNQMTEMNMGYQPKYDMNSMQMKMN